MTAKQWAVCEWMARGGRDLTGHDDSMLDGLYLPNFPAPVLATAEAVARAARWQCRYLNGLWDQAQLVEFRSFVLRRVELAPSSELDVDTLRSCFKLLQSIEE